MTTTAHTVSPITTGNYGSYPYLCGRNGGLHCKYVPDVSKKDLLWDI